MSLHIDSTHLSIGNFDTNNRYMRKVANPAHRTFYAVTGPSIGLTVAIIGSSSVQAMVWKWQVGAASFVGRDYNGKAASYASSLPTPSGFNTSFDAAA